MHKGGVTVKCSLLSNQHRLFTVLAWDVSVQCSFLYLNHFLCCLPQAATPLSCHCLLTREFERVGVLRYKAMRDPSQWKEGYFVLQKSNLFICPGNDGAAEDIINLKRLQELSESPVPTKALLALCGNAFAQILFGNSLLKH